MPRSKAIKRSQTADSTSSNDPSLQRSLPLTPASTGGTNTPNRVLSQGSLRSLSFSPLEDNSDPSSGLRKRSIKSTSIADENTNDKVAAPPPIIPTINPHPSTPELELEPLESPTLRESIMSLFGKSSSLSKSKSSSTKYTSLPVNSNPEDPYGPSSPSRSSSSSGRRSTSSKYKKYLIFSVLAFIGLLVLADGGRRVGKRLGLVGGGKSGQQQEFGLMEDELEGEGEYYGEENGLEGGWPGNKPPSGFAAEEEDPEAFASPPFLDKPISTLNDDDAEEEEEETSEDFHILPAGGLGRPTRPGHKQGGQSLPDLAEIDAEEQDDDPVNGVTLAPTHGEEDDLDAQPDFEDVTQTNEDASGETGAKGPTSFEDDPNPSGTTFCDRPHTEGSKIVQYALTIDAGSTGSRIHAYKFNNCGPTPALEYETFMAINPGLSSFKNDPTAAAESLDPLMEEALRVVPEELRSCTPVEVKATAGLRLLEGSQGQAILDEVRQRLETDWPFALGREESAVEIMDGKDEGVYAWITANYLLGRIGTGTSGADSIAVMDLGGASTQIVFEPNFPADSGLALADGDHKYALTFGGRDFTLYQHSYLGYGLMRARRSVNNLVAFTWSFLQPGGSTNIEWDDLVEEVEIPNPCLSKSTRRRVELDPPGRKSVNVTMVGAESGFEACNRVVQLVMAKDAVCEVKPCSFNGVYQPSLLETFPSGQLLALSYFTDRIQPLIKPFRQGKKGLDAETLTIDTVATMARAVCAGPASWKKTWGRDKAAMFELEDRPEYCLDMTFMHALLGLGYELGGERELVVEKKLRGVELGWALGAGIAMVEKSTLTCTA